MGGRLHYLKEGFIPLFLFAKICQNYVKALHIIFKSSFRNLTQGVRISRFKQQKIRSSTFMFFLGLKYLIVYELYQYWISK